MMKSRRRKNKRKIIIFKMCILLAVLIVISIVAIVLKKNFIDRGPEKENKVEIVEQTNDNQNDDEWMKINTKYQCDLYFPKMYSEKIKVKNIEEDGYKVEFYGLLEEKAEKHLFDVCFNSDYGSLIGYIETNKDIVNISIDVNELEFTSDWNQEEINEMYAIQEQVNYVIENLSKNKNYVKY